MYINSNAKILYFIFRCIVYSEVFMHSALKFEALAFFCKVSYLLAITDAML